MWTFFLVQLVGLISPGPDFFYVARKAMGDSRRSAILASIGITVGIAFWTLAVIFGLTVLIRHFPAVQQILMLLGGCYLAYSGNKMVRVRQSTKLDENVQLVQHRPALIEMRDGLMINLSNAKIVAYYSSVLAGYMADLSHWSDILAVLLILTGSAIIYFILIALLLSHKNIRTFYAKHNRYLDNFAGIVFILFGAKLVYEAVTSLSVLP